MLHEYSLFQIPALVFTAIVGALISCGIYEYVIKTTQPALPSTPAPGIGSINVEGDVGSVSLSIKQMDEMKMYYST